MTLDINGYNDTFKAFVSFAQSRESKDDIARGSFGENGALAGHAIPAATTDRLRSWRNWGRNDDEQNANNIPARFSSTPSSRCTAAGTVSPRQSRRR